MGKQIECVDCQKEFVLTKGEVEFFTTHKNDRGNTMNLPKRCKDCRIKRKTRSGTAFNRIVIPTDKEMMAKEPDDFSGPNYPGEDR